MRPYGKTLRYLRLQYDLSIQETYLSCMSRTSAYHLEQGEREVSLEQILQILDNLGGFSLEAFLDLHEQLYPSPLPKKVSIRQEFQQLRSKLYDYSAFFQFYSEKRQDKAPNVRFFAFYAHFIYLSNQSIAPIYAQLPADVKTEFTEMVHYLLGRPHWTKEELHYCLHLEPYFPFQLRQRMRRRWESEFERFYQNDDNSELVYANQQLNFLYHDLLYEDWTLFRENLQRTEAFFAKNRELYIFPNYDCRLLIFQAIRAQLDNQPALVQTVKQRLSLYTQAIPEHQKQFALYQETLRFFLRKLDLTSN